MGIASAQDSHPRLAKIATGIWPVFSIVNRYLRVPKGVYLCHKRATRFAPMRAAPTQSSELKFS